MSNKELFLDNAYKIGKKICGQALWKDDKCTWQILVPDRSNYHSSNSHYESAGGELYMGTAGISVFLVELYKQFNEDMIKKTAIGALNHSLEEAKKLPLNSFGFHSGRIGIAYALNKAGDMFGRDDFLEIAHNLVLEMMGKESKDFGIDVIGGAGGSIPVILQLANFYNDDKLFTIAFKLGENLIKKANRGLIGWSWGSNNNINARNLCGYAHGASGIGHALLELYNATSSDYFLYPAEQAFLYERQFFNKGENNWPDFRHIELAIYYYKESFEQMRARALRNEFIKYSPKYMSAWCHGAPGIGLSRIRAYELLKNKIYKEEAINATLNAINSINLGKDVNYSLCHGLFGNAETLVYAHNVLGNKEYYTKAQEIALRGIEESEKQKGIWKCGTLNRSSDPSLMLGEAGIGYFLLKLIDPNVKSVLVPLTYKKYDFTCIEKKKNELIIDTVNNYLFRTISQVNQEEINTNLAFSKNTDPVIKSIRTIHKVVKAEAKCFSDKKLLQESMSIESTTFKLLKQEKDFTSDYIYSLKKPAFELLNNEKAVLKLHPLCRKLRLHYNWSDFETERFLKKEEGLYLLFIEQSKSLLRKLNLLSRLIIDEINNGITVSQLVKNVTTIFDLKEKDNKEELGKRIFIQLKELYNANIIVADLDTVVTANTITGDAHKCDHCEKHALKL